MPGGRVAQVSGSRERTRWSASRAAARPEAGRGTTSSSAWRRVQAGSDARMPSGPAYLGVSARWIASSTPSGGPPLLGRQVWSGRHRVERRGRGQRRRQPDDARRGERRRQPQPRQPRLVAADAHQVGVGDHVGPTQVDGAAWAVVGQRVVHGAQHVGDRDRLDAAAQPGRHRLHKEQGGDLADDLERRRARPDDHARTQRGGAVDRTEQDPLDLEPGGEVRGQVGLRHVGHETGQVDESAYVARGHRGRHRLGPDPVAVGEVGAVERVDEVDDRVDALDRLRDRGGVGDVAPDGAHAVVPAEVVGPGRGGRGGDHVVAVLEEVRHQARPDVAGGAQDEDLHASPRCRRRFREKTVPMCFTTPDITRSTAGLARPGSGRVQAIWRSMLTSVPPPAWSARR